MQPVFGVSFGHCNIATPFLSIFISLRFPFVEFYIMSTDANVDDDVEDDVAEIGDGKSTKLRSNLMKPYVMRHKQMQR